MAFVLFMVYMQESVIWRWGIAPLVLLGVMNYVFQPQIDYWWFEKMKPTLDPMEHRFLEKHLAFYRSLADEEKEEFGRECIRFNHNKEYILQGVPSLPADLKIAVAAYATSLRYAFRLKEEDPFSKIERVVFYPHPFMSPDIDEVHASETHYEDGVWIFSLEQLIPGVTQPKKFFNILVYEMAVVLIEDFPDFQKELSKYTREEIDSYRRTLSDIPLERIQKWINLKDINQQAIYITALLSHWEEVSALSEQERKKLPLGEQLHYLDVLVKN